MHPFAGAFAVLAAADVVIVLVGACVRAVVCRGRPLAFHALATWSLIVVLAHAGNEWGLGAGVILGVIAAALTALVGACAFRRTVGALRPDVVAQWPDIRIVLAVLLLQVALYLVPLWAVFPSRTLITGNFVCNDSVAHAVLMRGFHAVHREFAAWEYLGYYPDGLHAVAFALTPLFPTADVPFFLLPVTIWAAAFLGLPILMLLDGEAERSGPAALFIASSPAAAFLLSTSVYLYFLGHMAALPLIVGAVVIVGSWAPEDVKGGGLLLGAAPIVAGAAVYGLFSVTLVGLAAALRAADAARHPTRVRASVRELATACIQPGPLACAALVLLLSAPVVVQMYKGFSFFASQTASVGNLPNGFLSPFHVTGFWKGGAEYRAPLTGPDSFAATLLAGVLAIQVWLVARAQLSRATIVTLAAVAVPVGVSSVLLRNPYINFKYLSLATAVWVPLSWLGLVRLLRRAAPRVGWRAADAVLVLGIALMVAVPLRSFRLLPPLRERWFKTLETIRSGHFVRGPVLVLSGEDWFQYYRDPDDIAPLTLYFHQTYAGQPMREVMIDAAFRREASSFLDSQMPGAVRRLATCAADTADGRFTFYDFACLAGQRP